MTVLVHSLEQVVDTKVPALKAAIDAALTKYGIPLSMCRAQGYDGASNMSGMNAGLHILVKECSPNVHCCGHRLNLCIFDSSKAVPSIADCFSVLQQVYNIVSASTKRNHTFKALQVEALLKKVESELCLDTGKGKNQLKTITTVSDTRWNCCVRNIIAVLENYMSVGAVVDLVGQGTDDKAALARGVSQKLGEFKFVFHMQLMGKISCSDEDA
jgi:hypothetical protein